MNDNDKSGTGNAPPANAAPPPVADSLPQNLHWDDHRKAVDGIEKAFVRWSGRLTDSSLTLSLAVIGANWALCGGPDGLIRNACSKWAVLLVFSSIGVHLIGAAVVVQLLRNRRMYAEKDVGRWSTEFQANSKNDQSAPWPFTISIRRWILMLRWLKIGLPFTAGVLTVFAFLNREPTKPPVQPIACCPTSISPAQATQQKIEAIAPSSSGTSRATDSGPNAPTTAPVGKLPSATAK